MSESFSGSRSLSPSLPVYSALFLSPSLSRRCNGMRERSERRLYQRGYTIRLAAAATPALEPRPLEITPRPCHINYGDSFRSHLQWANLARGNPARACAGAHVRATAFCLYGLCAAINRGEIIALSVIRRDCFDKTEYLRRY